MPDFRNTIFAGSDASYCRNADFSCSLPQRIALLLCSLAESDDIVYSSDFTLVVVMDPLQKVLKFDVILQWH